MDEGKEHVACGKDADVSLNLSPRNLQPSTYNLIFITEVSRGYHPTKFI